MKKKIIIISTICTCVVLMVILLVIKFSSKEKAVPSDAASKAFIQSKIVNTNNKILLIGIDALDWDILDLLLSKGKLPHFAQLKEKGACGILRSQKPMLSPILWTTIATGRKADEHGIVDFFMYDTESKSSMPASSSQRKVKALWNILSDFNRTSTFIGWFGTWPAEPINGYMISDQVAYQLFKTALSENTDTAMKVYPESLFKKISPLMVTPQQISYEEISHFVHIEEREYDKLWEKEQLKSGQEESMRNPINHLRDVLSSTRTYHQIALQLLRKQQTDLFSIYYEGVDTVCHLFMNYSPPRLSYIPQADYKKYKDAVYQFYQYTDGLVGELLSEIDNNTTVIIISDHGFLSGADRPRSDPADFYGKGAAWHRVDGGVVMMSGKDIKKGKIEGATLFDIAPTILYLSGFPISSEMDGSPLLSAISADFKNKYPVQFIETYEKVNPIQANKRAAITLPEDEKDKIKKKFMALGYISSDDSSTVDPAQLTNVNNLGLVYYELKEYEKAEAEFLKALQLRSDYVDALHNLALVYMAQGKGELALQYAAKMLTSSMSIGEQEYIFIIKLGERFGYLAELEKILQHQIKENPDKIEPLIALGKLYWYLKRNEQAEAAYKKALLLKPDAQMPLLEMFDYLIKQNRVDEAKQLLAKAIEQDTTNAFLITKLGTIHLQQGNFLAAQKEFEKAAKLEPEQFEPLFYLGLTYASQGKLWEAVDSFEKVLQFYPDNYDALLNLGATFAKLRELDRALATFKKAYSLGPKTPMLLNSLGMVYLQLGSEESAINIFEESLRLFPDQPDAKIVEDYLRQIRQK
jgi:predicted AlkP superfamily phosphohydrolase/phosphomutase/Tfp pilus assembly protein PilF